MPKEFSRIRVSSDQCELWLEILFAARNARIKEKIRLRDEDPDAGDALEALRWELAEINRMCQEVQRAYEELVA
jgi:hypothetical protein